MPDVFRPPPSVDGPSPASFGGMDSGITHGLLGLGEDQTAAAIDSNQVPDDFNTYVQVVLWKQGVDVSRMGLAQYQELAKALWQDPYIKDLYSSAYVGGVGTDPLTGAPVTDANFESAINYELFDPTRTHNQYLLSQGLSLLTLSGRQLSSSQQSYAQNLGGGNPAVMSALARAAQDAGVPYNVALAVAMAESGLNPKAENHTSREDSYGLFQLNTRGGEGAGMSMQDLLDPYTNALRALRHFAEVAAQDPTVTSDPGRWAAIAQGADNTNNQYANRVNNLLQSGFGGNPSGLVPKPYDGSYPITEDHSEGDPGIDYGTPVGTAMYTPFAGTIRTEDHGKQDWGKRVMVVLDNGYTYYVGHLSSFSVTDGERVDPGALLGLSGGDPSDPSSGDTTGPHIEIGWISPGGNFLDPHPIIDPILTGTATFRSLNLTGAESITGAQSGLDPTSRMLGVDPILEKKYPTAVSKFEQYMGRHPTSGELTNLIGHGTTPTELDAYLRIQPSHIPGVSLGMYQDVKGNLDSVSQSLFGHAGTDGMVKELADQGLTSPTAVKSWLINMDIEGKMGPGQYQTLYQLNAPHMQAVYNAKGFDPRIAQQQYQQAQQQGIPVPSTSSDQGKPPRGSQMQGL